MRTESRWEAPISCGVSATLSPIEPAFPGEPLISVDFGGGVELESQESSIHLLEFGSSGAGFPGGHHRRFAGQVPSERGQEPLFDSSVRLADSFLGAPNGAG